MKYQLQQIFYEKMFTKKLDFTFLLLSDIYIHYTHIKIISKTTSLQNPCIYRYV